MIEKKKYVKADIRNVESFTNERSFVDITTKCNSRGTLFYVIRVNIKRSNGSWYNQRITVFEWDIHILESLLRKSVMFAGSIPKKQSGFVKASGLYKKSNLANI